MCVCEWELFGGLLQSTSRVMGRTGSAALRGQTGLRAEVTLGMSLAADAVTVRAVPQHKRLQGAGSGAVT